MLKDKIILLSFPNSASSSLKSVINKHSDHRCKKLKLKEPNLINYFRNLLFKIIIKLLLIFFKFNLNLNINFIDRLVNIVSKNEYKFMGYYNSDIILNNHIKENKKYEKYMNKLIEKKKIDCKKVERNLILKSHFAPTEFNKNFFKNYKKILLFRDEKNGFKRYSSINVNNYFHKYFISKIEKEATIWKKKWMEEPNTICLDFAELINEPNKNLKIIENFTDLKFSLPDNFEFPKLNSFEKGKRV